MKKLDEFDIKALERIAQSLQIAADKAEKESLQIYGESVPAYEFGFLKGYVEHLGMQIEAIIGKK